MAASGSGSLECQESGSRGLRVVDRSEPTSHRNIVAWFSVTIAFVMSVGMGFFVLGPFESMHAMARSDVKKFAAGLGLHHKAPYVRMKQPGQGPRPSHFMVMNPSRTTGHAAVNMFANPAVPLANMQQNHDKNMVFYKKSLGPLNRKTVGPKLIRMGLIRGRWTRVPQPVRLVAGSDDRRKGRPPGSPTAGKADRREGRPPVSPTAGKADRREGRPPVRPTAEDEMGDESFQASAYGDTGPDGFHTTLIDPESGFKIDGVNLEATFIDDELYSAMIPRDVAATITRMGKNEMLEIDDDDELEKLFPLASAACEENNIQLLNTAVTFTLSGDPETIDDLVEENKGLEEVPQSEEDPEAEDPEAEVVVPFFCEGKKYYVVRFNDPIVMVGRQVSMTTFEIPSEDEMEVIGPKMESLMEMNRRIEDGEVLEDDIVDPFDDDIEDLD